MIDHKILKRLIVSLWMRCLVFVFIVCTIFTVSGCKDNKKNYDGSYVSEDGFQTFTFSDNNLTLSAFGINAKGTYLIIDDEINISYDMFGNTYELTKPFHMSGNTLTINGTELKKVDTCLFDSNGIGIIIVALTFVVIVIIVLCSILAYRNIYHRGKYWKSKKQSKKNSDVNETMLIRNTIMRDQHYHTENQHKEYYGYNFCPMCGKKIIGKYNFCPFCGNQLVER